jgi:hypothetical protein
MANILDLRPAKFYGAAEGEFDAISLRPRVPLVEHAKAEVGSPTMLLSDRDIRAQVESGRVKVKTKSA